MTLQETNRRCGWLAESAMRTNGRLFLAAAVLVFMGTAAAPAQDGSHSRGHDGSHSRNSDARYAPGAAKSQGRGTCGGRCGMGGSCGSESAGLGQPAPPALAGSEPPMAMARLAPHGGQVTAASRHDFEVVYAPQEVRIYIYSPAREQLSAEGVRGEVVMQVNSYPQLFRYPVRPVTDAAGLSYLSVPVDVRRVRDGDMQVTFDLAGLPLRDEPRARFTQTFALTRSAAPGPQRAAGQRPPGQNRTMAPAASAARPAPHIVVTQATAADEAAIRAQGVCPVLGNRLGEHGTPVKILIDGQPLFVCCKGCVNKVKKNPRTYLAKLPTR